MVDILLVNPNSRFTSYGKLADDLAAIEPPFWAGLMADDFRKQGKEVRILDAEAEGLDFAATVSKIKEIDAAQVIVVAMGVNPSASSTPKMRVVERLAEAITCKITGLHPMALPEMRIGGRMQTLVWHPDTSLSVAWDLLPMEKYRAHNWHCFGGIPRGHYGVLYTSLGCPWACTYCNIHTLYEKRFELRSITDSLGELDTLVQKYKVHNIKIMDELFTVNKAHVIAFCEGVIERGYNLNMWAYARVGTVTPEMLKLMKRAGINWLGIGFESVVPRIRKGVQKSYSISDEYDTIAMIKRVGINIAANYIFGLPDDDYETMQQTLDIAKYRNFEYVNFYCAAAYPGSELYKQQENPSQDWNTYAQLSYEFEPLPTKYLTSAQVLGFRDKAFIEYFSRKEYQEMMQSKFGSKAVDEIKLMLDRNRMKRRILK